MIAPAVPEISEEVLHEAVDARTEQLLSLRELGPPDLVHLLKQPLRNAGKQVCTLVFAWLYQPRPGPSDCRVLSSSESTIM